MKKPERHLVEQLGDLRTVEVLGRTYDLHREVSIPEGVDIEELIQDHTDRYGKWRRLRAEQRRMLDEAKDALEEHTSLRFMQYWQTCEQRERDEMKGALHDEAEMAKDPFRASARARERVMKGPTAMRWSRNFTDALIQSYVNSDTRTIELKKALREAKRALDIIDAITDTLDHRMRCLSHLCALHRDAARQ